MIPFIGFGQSLLNVKKGAVIKLDNGALFYVDGNVNINDGTGAGDKGKVILSGEDGSDVNGNNSSFRIAGDLLLDGLFVESGGRLWFVGDKNSRFSSNIYSDFSFYQIVVDKDEAERVILEKDLSITNNLRLLKGRFDIGYKDLIFEKGSNIYANWSNQYNGDLWSAANCIYFSKQRNYGGGTDAGQVVYKIPDDHDRKITIFLPLATVDQAFSEDVTRYSPTQIDLDNLGGTNITYGSDAYVGIQLTPEPHPGYELEDLSLDKYWSINTNNITINAECVDIDLTYTDGDVPDGCNEGTFEVLQYSPAYNNPAGYWRINPSTTVNVVEFAKNEFYSRKLSVLEGDWTAGDRRAIQVTYYSRQDGAFNDKNTWSTEKFGGPPASSAPSKRTDKIYIGEDESGNGHTVTVTENVEYSEIIEVQSNGTLVVDGEYEFVGDSLAVRSGATFKVAHPEGFTLSEGYLVDQGCVQTDVRIFESDANYHFIGGASGDIQKTGDGLPLTVRNLVIDRAEGATTDLEKTVLVNGSLIIEEGIFNLDNNFANGASAGRDLVMNGGELKIITYPENYKASTFEAGTIHFQGTGNSVVPSENTTPGVKQYYNLKFSGERDGVITFQSDGEIKISNDLDISELTFSPEQPYRYATNRSTINFNGADQTIPYLSSNYDSSKPDLRLSYGILKLEGTGTKTLQTVPIADPPDNQKLKFEIYEDLLINGVTLDANGTDISILGDWVNNGGTFVPGTEQTVEMYSTAALQETKIEFNGDDTNNPFYNLNIVGDGIVYTDEDLDITNDLTITESNLELSNNEVVIGGDWTNTDGEFIYATSKIIFDGQDTHTLTNSEGNAEFYNFEVRERTDGTMGLVEVEGLNSDNDEGLIINNDLTLNGGVIKTLGHYAYVDGTITRVPGKFGHIWGGLRKPVAKDDITVNYEVGGKVAYTPIELEFNGTGGIAGMLQIESDTITHNPQTSPIYRDASGDILPDHSWMHKTRSVLRQWKMIVPENSTFSLGSRNYDATATFVPGDLKDGADPLDFEPRLLPTGSQDWIIPLTSMRPTIGQRTATSTEFEYLRVLGTMAVGEGYPPSYYSIKDGPWNDKTSWSTQGYDGDVSDTYPPPYARVFIGNGKTITIGDGAGDIDAFAEGLVLVEEDGTLVFEDNAVLGRSSIGGADDESQFIMMSDATIHFSHENGTGTDADHSNGNIKMNDFNLNYNNHNNGNFSFGRSDNATIAVGEGIPDVIKTFTVDNTDNASTSKIHLYKDVTITDSLDIQDGTLVAGNDASGSWVSRDITLYGNVRLREYGEFDCRESNFTFTDAGADIITVETDTPMEFYNFIVSKKDSTGNVILSKNSGINILNQLEFAAGNSVLINSRNNGSYVQIDKNVPDTWLARNGGGWVNGELRRWIPEGSIAQNDAIFFPIGNGGHYSPFELGFMNAGTNDVAGYVGCYVQSGDHPELEDFGDTYRAIDPERTALRYWRMVKPNGSSFAQGDRRPYTKVYTVEAYDLVNVDDPKCMDIAMWDGSSSSVPISPPPGYKTYSGWTHFDSDAIGICTGVRSLNKGINDFTYDYGQIGSRFTTGAYPRTYVYQFGNTLTVDDGILLGDFIIGNTNEVQEFVKFYSIKDGAWNDPTTWSTKSHLSNENKGSVINFDTDKGGLGLTGDDRIFYPVSQYDHAYIDSNHTVTVKGGTGHISWKSSDIKNGKMGPNVSVGRKGIIDLSYGMVSGHSFDIKAGGTLILGSHEGLQQQGFSAPVFGNVYTRARTFAGGINIIYKPTGLTPRRESTEGNCMLYDSPTDDSDAQFISNVKVLDGATTLLSCTTCEELSDNLANVEYTAEVEAGTSKSYTLDVTRNNNGSAGDLITLWIDVDRDGIFEDNATEKRINNQPFMGDTDSWPFTVPEMAPGLTFMKVSLQYNSGTKNYESEIYGLIVKNEDWNEGNNGIMVHNMGPGTPGSLRSLTIHSEYGDEDHRALVRSPHGLTISTDLHVRAGQFDMDGDSIKIVRDFVTDTLDCVIPNKGVLYFIGNNVSEIRKGTTGNTASLELDHLTIDKDVNYNINDKLHVKMDMTVNGNLDMRTNSPIELDDNLTMTLGPEATILGRYNNNQARDFFNQRMIIVSGDENSGVIKKEYPTDSDAAVRTVIPIGVAAVPGEYPATIHTADLLIEPKATTNLVGDPWISVKLRKKMHDELLNGNHTTPQGLKVYWTLASNDLDDPEDKLERRNFEFHYSSLDTVGNVTDFLPAVWRKDLDEPTGEWDVNVGEPTKLGVAPSPLYAHSEILESQKNIDGDWTAAISTSMYVQRDFYSLNDGVWNEPTSWTNDTVRKYPSSYYPGQVMENDRVHIDCHKITYNVVDHINHINTLDIGCRALCDKNVLTFGDATGGDIDHKSLHVHGDLHVCAKGRIDRENVNDHANRDTLTLYTSLINEADGQTTPKQTNEIIQINPTNQNPDYTIIRFTGGELDGENTTLTGEGAWNGLAEIIMDKTNTNPLEGSLVIDSDSFSDQTAVEANGQLRFVLESGMLEKQANTDLYLSSEGEDVDMGTFSGIKVTGGSVNTRGDLTTGAKSEIIIDGGDLNVGTSKNDHFFYKSGLELVLEDGDLNVAGAFARYLPNSVIDLTLKPTTTINVLKVGSDERGIIGFDIMNAGSKFVMDNAKVVVHNPTGITLPELSIGAIAMGSGMQNNSVIQIGETGTTYSGNQDEFYIEATLPIENLLIAGVDNKTYQANDNLYVTGEIKIEDESSFSINGNTFNLAGDLINYGDFIGAPSVATIQPWKTILYGNKDQTIYNKDAYHNDFIGIELYNLRFDKREVTPGTPSMVRLGSAVESDKGYSGLTVRNSLDFGIDNNSYLDAETNKDAADNELFLLMKEKLGSVISISRNGLGHVYGRFLRDITTVGADYEFVVGSNNTDDYYPATITFSGNPTHKGIVGVKYTKQKHQKFDEDIIDNDRDLEMYWNVGIPSASSFELGDNSNFKLKTIFKDVDRPADYRYKLGEHFVYANGENGTTWYTTTTLEAKETYVISERDFRFGDYIVAEPEGIHFYSVKENGVWNDHSSWSSEYGGTPYADPDKYPKAYNHVAHIGDGCTITITDENDYRIQAALIEDDMGTSKKPGKLFIDGYDYKLSGKYFKLDDNCTIGMQHWKGLDGVLSFGVQEFGLANYVYYLNTGSQVSGQVLPNEVLSLTVDNQTLVDANKYMSFSNDSPTIIVHDYITVANGRFSPYTRDIELRGDIRLHNKGQFRYAQGKFIFAAGADKDNNIYLGGDTTLVLEQVEVRSNGVRFNVTADANLDQVDLDRMFLITDTRNLPEDVPQLIFNPEDDAEAIIHLREANGDLVYDSENPVRRDQNRGHVNGGFAHPFPEADDTEYYHIGTATKYLPVKVTTDAQAGGTAGFITATSYDVVPNEPYWGNRLDLDKRVEDYWKLEEYDGFTMGSRRLNLEVDFPTTDQDAAMDRTHAVFRRHTLDDPFIPWQRRAIAGHIDFDDYIDALTQNRTTAKLSTTADKWRGEGEFFIGEMPIRTFYSCGSGDWNDRNTWSFDEDCSTTVPEGIFPNQDWDVSGDRQEIEIFDKVIIQNSDVVDLNTRPELVYLEIKGTSTLSIEDGNYVEPTSETDLVEGFKISDTGRLDLETTYGIEPTGEGGAIRFPDNKRTYSPNAEFEFSGTGPQELGSAFPTEIGSLIINNSSDDDIISLNDVALTINDNLIVTDGELRSGGDNSDLTIKGDITVADNGVLDLSKDKNGTPVDNNLVLTGTGNQTIGGNGSSLFDNISPSKTAGSITINGNIAIADQFDLTNNNGTDIDVSSVVSFVDTECLEDYVVAPDANNFFNLDADAGGRLNFRICPNHTYLYPIGSIDTYSPVTFVGGDGTAGFMALSTDVGGHTTKTGAHIGVSDKLTTDWIKRYWTVDNNMTAEIDGSLSFKYVDGEVNTDENEIDALGRWRPGHETENGGYWDFWTNPEATFDRADNKATAVDFEWEKLAGDWTMANVEAFRRIFYSLKQWGNWNELSSWTMNPSHTGEQYGAFPDTDKDSVVIGMGHLIVLDADREISGILIGNPAVNNPIGYLHTNEHVLSGKYFDMIKESGIAITDKDGITKLGEADADLGNIRFSERRNYGSAEDMNLFTYLYSDGNQKTGSGLPQDVGIIQVMNKTNLNGVEITDPARNNNLTFDNSVVIHKEFKISNGSVILGDKTATASKPINTQFIQAAGTLISIGNGNNFKDALDNYATYNMVENSWVEFNGDNQNISELPTNAVDNGYANVLTIGQGTRTVEQSVRVRGDFHNLDKSTLQILQAGSPILTIEKTLNNCANIENEGQIEIGD